MPTTKKTVRKLVTLPLELAGRVDAFRQKSGAASESDALKALIDDGLKAYDTDKDLFERCRLALAEGKNVGELITQVIGDHPLVQSTQVGSTWITITLKRNDLEADARFYYDKLTREWSTHVHVPKVGWGPAAFDVHGKLDDEIPF